MSSMKRAAERPTVQQFYEARAINGRAVVVGTPANPEAWIVRLRPSQGPPRYFLAYAVADHINELPPEVLTPQRAVSANGWGRA